MSYTLQEIREAVRALRQVIYGGGPDAQSPGYVFGGTVPFTGSGTFTKADYPGLRAIRVRMVGGGGQGGGCAATTSTQAAAGFGGGGGAYAESFILVSDLDTTEAVTVGAGGSGAGTNAAGNDGGDSIFDTISGEVRADGGAGGGAGGAATPPFIAAGSSGNGGDVANSVGDIRIPGQHGQHGMCISTSATQGSFGGAGGASMFGPMRSPFRGSGTGDSGQVYGAGGVGGSNANTQSARAGGAGGAGIVLVDLYY